MKYKYDAFKNFKCPLLKCQIHMIKYNKKISIPGEHIKNDI